MKLSLQSDSDSPIYQQIVTSIRASIHEGTLPVGYKLPTVRDLAAEVNISRGTVKHAYEELEKLGLIQMTQGRGTFVLGAAEPEATGRKERALCAIDRLITELEDMSFGPHEIEIFFDLKMREHGELTKNISIGIVDCNPETLQSIYNQLAAIQGVDIYKFELDGILENPEKFGDSLDLIVTTSHHFSQLEEVVETTEKIVRTVLSITQSSAASLAKIEQNQRIGMMCTSRRFAAIMRSSCMEFCGTDHSFSTHLFDEKNDIEPFLASCDVLVVTPDYLRFCSASDAQAIRHFTNAGGDLVRFNYQIDDGSLFYLNEKIEKLLKSKRA